MRFGLIAGMLLVAAALPGASGAAAGDDLLHVSHDGVLFTRGSGLDLFTDPGAVVPGDRRSERIWFRSDASGPGLLRLYLVEVAPMAGHLTEATTLTVTDTRDTTRGSASLADADAHGCLALPGEVELGAGEVVALDVALAIDAALGSRQGDTGTAGATETVSFSLRATLADAGVASLPDPCGDQGAPSPTPDPASDPTPVPTATAKPRPDDALAGTGGAFPTGAAIAAASLLATGGALWGLGRRRDRARRRRGES